MKNFILTIFVLFAVVTTSCKKATITKKMNSTTWQLMQVQNGSEDVTALILKTEIVYTKLTYSNDGNNIIFSNPNSLNVIQEESGDWQLEKIVPTVGDSYYLIRNILEYSFERRKLFNLSEYGSEVLLTKYNILTQTKGDYTFTYEKLN